MRCAVLFMFLLIPVARSEDEATPESRLGDLRADCAAKHAALGIWAANKKMGLEARAHLYAAIRLDPDCRKARVKLGHRRGKDGQWNTGRERKIRDEAGAREKHGEDFATREQKVLAEEASAYATLGLALKAEGHSELARELLLHAFFLDPTREETAKGLSLVRLCKGFGPKKIAEEVASTSRTTQAGSSRWMGGTIGVATKVRCCGSTEAEVQGSDEVAKKIATFGQQALILTLRRFTEAPVPPGIAMLALAGSQEKYNLFVDKVIFDERDRSISKAIGSARIYSPRYCIATFYVEGLDPVKDCARIFVHMMPEGIAAGCGGPKTPTWLLEAVGVDAELTILGTAKTCCITWEESQGMVTKEAFAEVGRWPSMLFRRAAMDDLPKLEHLMSAQIQAMSPEDVVGAHAYYRLLYLTHPENLGRYLQLLAEEKSDLEAFRTAFGCTQVEFTKRLATVLLGR